MSKVEKQIATVVLIDDHQDVAESSSVVAKYEDICYTGSEQDLIQYILLECDVKDKIAVYNAEVRTKTVNKTTLERTGNEVKLQPVKFKDLVIQVK